MSNEIASLDPQELNALANLTHNEKIQKQFENPIDVIREEEDKIYLAIKKAKENGYKDYTDKEAKSLEDIYNAIGTDTTMNLVISITVPFYVAVMLLCIFSLSRASRRNSIVPM
ncbi:MAG: hypothetical protein K5978_06190 [Campylobacter sp.]|nr:hypothetical protein [Campylobacter sp.]